MRVVSSVFKHNGSIPKKYSCEGEDVSPPLTIHDLPQKAQSIAIIMDDPDAPMGTFDHWIAWNISPDKTDWEEGIIVPVQGKNHFNELRYRGPCPPKGPAHRYFFKVYALDNFLDLPAGSTKEQLEEAIEGHILGKGEVVGTFQR